MPVYDDEKTKTDLGPGSHDDLGVHPEHAEAETSDLEKQFAADSAPEPTYGKSADPAQLKDDEEKAADEPYGPSLRDEITGKVGKGYTGRDGEKKTLTSRLFNSKSKTKKRVAIAGAAAGGSALIGILMFFALLPLKIEHIVNNLENTFSSTTQDAMSKETDRLVNSYLAKYVLPGINHGLCRSTVDATCVGTIDKSAGPFKRLFTAWKEDKLETKLATKYGIILGKKDGQLFMNIDGMLGATNKDLQDVMNGRKSMFDIDNSVGSGRASRSEIRQAFRTAMKDATLWDKVYFRFKLGKLIETKYGVKRCIIACNIRDNFNDSKDAKKGAAKAFIIRRVLSPLSESYGLIAQCLMVGGGVCNQQSLDPAKQGDETRLTPVQRKLQEQLDAFAARFGADTLKDLFAASEKIGKDGFSKYMTSEITKKIAGLFGKEVSGEATSKAVPVIGWILAVARMTQSARTLGTTIKYIGYSASAAAAVQLYMSYRTVADELHSGHMDPAELGSFTDALGSTLDGSAGGSDATSTPLYGKLMGSNTKATTASVFGSLFNTSVSAESGVKSAYRCNDGNPVPNGQDVCNEEVFTAGNKTASAISDAVNNVVGSVPGLSVLIDVINSIGSVIGDTIGTVFNTACTAAQIPFTGIGCPDARDYITSKASALFKWIIDQLIDSPFNGNMSGGRTFDMMAAGADVSANASCREQLGCPMASDQTIAAIRNQYISEQKAAFEHQSLFARMFSTASPYSLVSSFAMDMPTTMLGATNASFASLLSNPLTKLGGAFSGIFSSNRAFAASAPFKDPFGVVQYAYSDSQIDPDPETYWNANCISGSMGWYDDTTGKLDISPWLNTHTTMDENTGEADPDGPNQCQLIMSTVQSAGGLFDPSLLPTDSTNGSGSTTTPSTGDISAYKNPFRAIGKNLLPNRVDQGVDYGTTVSGPVYAIGNGTVVHTADSGWPGGWFIVYKLSDGPAAGHYVFTAEGCPAKVSIGQQVTSDTVLCDMAVGGYSVELGWARDPSQGGWYAAATDEYHNPANTCHGNGYVTNFGQNFDKLMQRLGVPPGTHDSGCGVSTAPLPTGWPTW